MFGMPCGLVSREFIDGHRCLGCKPALAPATFIPTSQTGLTTLTMHAVMVVVVVICFGRSRRGKGSRQQCQYRPAGYLVIFGRNSQVFAVNVTTMSARWATTEINRLNGLRRSKGICPMSSNWAAAPGKVTDRHFLGSGNELFEHNSTPRLRSNRSQRTAAVAARSNVHGVYWVRVLICRVQS